MGDQWSVVEAIRTVQLIAIVSIYSYSTSTHTKSRSISFWMSVFEVIWPLCGSYFGKKHTKTLDRQHTREVTAKATIYEDSPSVPHCECWSKFTINRQKAKPSCRQRFSPFHWNCPECSCVFEHERHEAVSNAYTCPLYWTFSGSPKKKTMRLNADRTLRVSALQNLWTQQCCCFWHCCCLHQYVCSTQFSPYNSRSCSCVATAG